MPTCIRLPGRTLWLAALLAFLICSPEQASAQTLSKDEQKCVNTANKNAQKVASAQGKDIAACIKNGAKGKLTGTIEACVTSDPKGKVGKAES